MPQSIDHVIIYLASSPTSEAPKTRKEGRKEGRNLFYLTNINIIQNIGPHPEKMCRETHGGVVFLWKHSIEEYVTIIECDYDWLCGIKVSNMTRTCIY